MDIFDAPSREECLVRRERTNTPLQALVTMNDPQFVEAARVLAQKALTAIAQNLDQELNYMSNRLLARKMDDKERAIVCAFLCGLPELLSVGSLRCPQVDQCRRVWQSGSCPRRNLAAMTDGCQ